MAAFDAAEEWLRCMRCLCYTKLQWESKSPEEKAMLTDDEILRINMSFIEIQYYVDTRRHNAECLVGFYARYRELNKILMESALKMGYNVRIVTADGM